MFRLPATLLLVILRRELPEDRAAVFLVQTEAFGGGEDVVEARLMDDLRSDGDVIPALSIVATIGGDVVGHVVCSRATLDGHPSLGLGPLGVLPTAQGRGVGHALMHAVVAAADALDEPSLVLLGDPGFYRRFGFVLAATVGVLPPDPAWVGHFQVRRLHGWDDSVRGAFRYAKAFDRTLV